MNEKEYYDNTRNLFAKQKSESAVTKPLRVPRYPNLPKNYKGLMESRYLKSAHTNAG